MKQWGQMSYEQVVFSLRAGVLLGSPIAGFSWGRTQGALLGVCRTPVAALPAPALVHGRHGVTGAGRSA